ncbi:LuxE/PaaK family acyltransferase [Salibacter halophilus]|uniref:LuxE/PaaK family acyltransferase n=1 Tax=Salibacter halophilus TaxID=1803916 RepID=UPI001CB9BDE3|nr:acyl transferase [Salibacter halophilus]
MPETAEIWSIRNEQQFNNVALKTFRFQYDNVAIYREFVDTLKIDPNSIEHFSDIPFLPISFFKTQSVYPQQYPKPEVVFSSSGTTGSDRSQHKIHKLKTYRESFNRAFRQFYGKPEELAILGLLPSYLEREGSSLIYMVDDLIGQSRIQESGYYLYDHEALRDQLLKLEDKKQPTLLIGVSYALLDFVEKYSLDLNHTTVMETGGMKGKRKEMVKEELHRILQKGFGVESIHSEYGMTELLSQAYSSGHNIFQAPPWMKVLIRDTNDPFCYIENDSTGGLNIIDLANRYSCSFIATQDLGKLHDDGSFEVVGRFDNSDIRGCNLLVQ